MKNKFFTEMFLHVGGSSPLARGGKDVVEYDRTADVNLIASAKRNEQPLYEVKSRHGVTLDVQPTLDRARRVRDAAGNHHGNFIYEITPTGMKRRVA